MNKREKTLAAVCGLAAVAFVTFLAMNRLFLEPAADLARQAADMEGKIAAQEAQKQKEPAYKARLGELTGLSFGTDEMRVSEQVRTTVAAVLALSGLSTQNLSLKPQVGSRVPGVYREIGWAIRARGKLGQVINFMYLMTREPHLHRLDNLVLAPAQGSGGEVELQVKYATLLMEAPKGESLPPAGTVPEMPPDPALLAGPERRLYEVIAARDLFRPYIRRERAVAGASGVESRGSSDTRPVVGDRLVGLPTWDGRPEIMVADGSGGTVISYHAGDELAGGKIVTVDYRPMPMPGHPEILSGSRVVIRIASEYYAVELGQGLTEKRPLANTELPPGLPRLQTVDPGPVPVPAGEQKTGGSGN
jgi:hypothetical protein